MNPRRTRLAAALCVLAVLFLLGSVAVKEQQPAASETIYNFDRNAVGQPVAEFQSALTGRGPVGKWVVQADPTAPSKPNVLAQVSTDETDYRFPLAVLTDGTYRNVGIRVKFKAISGKVDQAAGLVFRLKNPDNYYIVRANALEDNYRLYRLVDGSRRHFAGANFKVTPSEWHELKVEITGNRIVCYYDGVKKIEATDDTFADAGRVGLWTKADSVTHFDDFVVKRLP